MKLDTQLFNSIIEQVREIGPDEDCHIQMGEGPISSENKVFVDMLRTYTSLAAQNVTGAVATAFYIGFESGLQYAKVSQEVKQLNQMVEGGVQ